jgi:hypothetical protein
MKAYDAQGRLKTSITPAGVNFLGGDYIRIKNGRLQLKSDGDGKWYYKYVQNDPGSGDAVDSIADVGETE